MIRILPSQTNENISRLFAPLGYHLAVASILDGKTPGLLYVDDLSKPQIGLAWFKHRVFLAGAPVGEILDFTLKELLQAELLAQAERSGLEAFILHVHPNAWEEHLPAILPGREPILGLREHYLCTGLAGDWRAMLPDGIELRLVEPGLAADSNLQGLGALRDEMVSEQALQRGYQEVGWHCWKRNLPSMALARRAGFALEREYLVYLYLLAE
jgi:hypothetical protein